MNNVTVVADKIRNGVLDINVQEHFFSILIKGLLYKLNSEIKIRNEYVPHMILHTGDDRMWIEQKGYNAAIEPRTISNENNVYGIIPRCIVNPSSIDLDTNQLTSPYSTGTCQYEIFEGDDEATLKALVEKGLTLLQNSYLGGSGSRGYGSITIKSGEWTVV